MSRQRVRVLSWRGRWYDALRSAVSEPFEHATGIRVEHHPHIGLHLPKPLRTALVHSAPPPVDVVWSNAVPALQAAAAGHCVPLNPSYLPAPGELHDRARPEGHTDVLLVHPYVVHYVLGYHAQSFPDALPSSWEALLDPRHRGKVALYPGGNGFYPIAQLMGGGALGDIPHAMAPCWSHLRNMRDCVGQLAYSIGMEELLRDRSVTLCFRALPNILAFQAAGVPMRWTVPQEGTSDALDALWIPRGTSPYQAELATRYIQFALRPDIQEQWCERLGALPVHRAASPPTVLRGHPRLPDHADDLRGILHVAESTKARHQPSWETCFQHIFS